MPRSVRPAWSLSLAFAVMASVCSPAVAGPADDCHDAVAGCDCSLCYPDAGGCGDLESRGYQHVEICDALFSGAQEWCVASCTPVKDTGSEGNDEDEDEDGGCSCRAQGGPADSAGVVCLLTLAALGLRRRRPRP